MEFLSKQKTNIDPSKKRIRVGYEEARDKLYSTPLTIYAVPPLGKVDLLEAEYLVEERISLLRVFSHKAPLTGTEWNADLKGSVKWMLHQVRNKDGGDNFYIEANNKLPSVHTSARRKDHVSHFLLRLYCSSSPELKKWFTLHEMKFLQFQLLDNDNRDHLDDFLKMNNFPFDTVKGEFRTELEKNPFFNIPNIKSTNIYQIELKEAFDVVRFRKCMLLHGMAYVLKDEMVGLICSKFKVELSKMMARLTKHLPRLQESDRLIPIIGSVYQETVTAADRRAENDSRLKSRARVTPQMVNTLAVESFPPCMKFIHENLRKNHHLKHYGRLYYGLFLKSIGMTVDDAIEFFRQEFVQKITPEKFAKEYSYNIRYSYGQEGKKVNLSAYGCQKIISSNPPGPGDAHGCPFRHTDNKNLEVMLRRYGVPDENLQDIMSEVTAKQYTGACTKFFHCKHPNASIRAENGLIYHPNQFFSESRRALSGFVQPAAEEEDGEQEAPAADPEKFDDDDDEGLMQAIDAMQNNMDAVGNGSAGAAAASGEEAEPVKMDTGEDESVVEKEEGEAMPVDPVTCAGNSAE